jgi:hypothetical protein
VTIRSPAPEAYGGEPLPFLPEEERFQDRQEGEDAAEAGRWGLCRMPLWGTASAPPAAEGSGAKVIRSLLPTRRRLRLDPPTKLYFPCTHPAPKLFFHLLLFLLASVID